MTLIDSGGKCKYDMQFLSTYSMQYVVCKAFVVIFCSVIVHQNISLFCTTFLVIVYFMGKSMCTMIGMYLTVSFFLFEADISSFRHLQSFCWENFSLISFSNQTLYCYWFNCVIVISMIKHDTHVSAMCSIAWYISYFRVLKFNTKLLPLIWVISVESLWFC